MSESNHLINFATSSELIANGEGRNVLSAIEDGLRSCDEFLISVAFNCISRYSRCLLYTSPSPRD